MVQAGKWGYPSAGSATGVLCGPRLRSCDRHLPVLVLKVRIATCLPCYFLRCLRYLLVLVRSTLVLVSEKQRLILAVFSFCLPLFVIRPVSSGVRLKLDNHFQHSAHGNKPLGYDTISQEIYYQKCETFIKGFFIFSPVLKW